MAPFNWLMHTEIPQVTPTQSANERAFTKEVLSVKPSNLPEGDKVLAKSNPPHKKCTTPYDPNPNIVRGCKETMVTAKSWRDREITRNSSFFKRVDDCTTIKREDDNDNDILVQQSCPPTEAIVPSDVPSKPYLVWSSRRAPEYLKHSV